MRARRGRALVILIIIIIIGGGERDDTDHRVFEES